MITKRYTYELPTKRSELETHSSGFNMLFTKHSEGSGIKE